ncbi:MAG: hypothetical protein WCI37_02405 [bacterium]
MSNLESPREDNESSQNIIKDLNKELSIQSKIGVVGILGGSALELSGIALNYIDSASNKAQEIVSSDVRFAGMVSIISGIALISERINSNSKRNN